MRTLFGGWGSLSHAALLFGVALTTAVAGCAKPRLTTRPERSALEAQPVDPRQGQVDYEFLLDPSFAASQLGPNERLWSPAPVSELQPPIYPERPLRAEALPSTVVVRIRIGTDGRVADVADSPKMASTPGPFLDDFRGAVEDAVRKWSFTPGRLADLAEDVDGDGKPDSTAWQLIPVYYDVRFDFEIVDGTGRVVGADLGPVR